MLQIKQGENRRLLADRCSSEPIAAIHGGPHVLVLFAIEDGIRLGANARVLLTALATVALEKGRRPPFAHHAHAFSIPTLASLWVRRWQRRMSIWLHLAISKHVIRIMCLDLATRLRYI